jgi:hypothetical protein
MMSQPHCPKKRKLPRNENNDDYVEQEELDESRAFLQSFSAKMLLLPSPDLQLQRKRVQEESDKVWADILNYRNLQRAQYLQLDVRRLALQEQIRAYTELHGNLEADGSDVIRLNVGGTRFISRRAVLTQLPKTKLASLFSGRCDKKLLRDEDDNIFLDVNPDCFRLILCYLSLCTAFPDGSPHPLSVVSQ